MKRLFALLAACLLISKVTLAQNDGSLTIDMLKAPSSPAFILLGISPTDVQKRIDPTELFMNVQNSSNQFTTIPKEYSLQLCPASIFGKTESLDEFLQKSTLKGKQNALAQSVTLSFGIHTPDSSKNLQQIALGVSFTLIRGQADQKTMEAVMKYKNALYEHAHAKFSMEEFLEENDSLLQFYNRRFIALGNSDSSIDSIQIYSNLTDQRKGELLNSPSEIAKYTSAVFTSELNDSLYEVVRQKAKAITINRVGFNLDAAGGTVMDFPNASFDTSYVSKWGAWLTPSFTTQGGFDIVGVVRMLYNINLPYIPSDGTGSAEANTFNIDVGGKITYNRGKLNLSLEYLSRSYTQSEFHETHRIMFNASYSFIANKALTFSFGRDFDGTITSADNLVATLNLLLGFGGQKSLF